MILFGHPTGNPNSHHAALAHFEKGRLEAFCLPWMPTPKELKGLSLLPGLKTWTSRYSRRCFLPLLDAPRIEGMIGEWGRIIQRVAFSQQMDERIPYQANDWLMRTMKRECHRASVSAVHSYEDCSLWQFEEAKRLGKKCIYDMPIGYYPAWEDTQKLLVKNYAEWLPAEGLPSSKYVRPEQKRKEMELADLVLAPSSFVKRTIQNYVDKEVTLAPYGVNLDFWAPDESKRNSQDVIHFIYAGQCSIRKGTHILLEAWEAANLKNAVLHLVGSWRLSREKMRQLPPNAKFVGHVSADALRTYFQSSDVFVFPSYFEGLGLVLLESMACGLPAIATTAAGGEDALDDDTGRIVPEGDVSALIESLRWFAANRDSLASMGAAARRKAETFTWEYYRKCVSDAVSFV